MLIYQLIATGSNLPLLGATYILSFSQRDTSGKIIRQEPNRRQKAAFQYHRVPFQKYRRQKCRVKVTRSISIRTYKILKSGSRNFSSSSDLKNDTIYVIRHFDR
jgi:hypothetical protein